MVSDDDRAHFAAIARAMDEANAESLDRAARNPRGRNIEEAFELSRFVMSRETDFTKPDPVPPIAIWRKLKRGGSTR